MSRLFFTLFALLGISVSIVLSAAVNSVCREGAVPWRCKSTETCDTLQKDDPVQICGFYKKPLVCCPPPSYNLPPRIRDNGNNNLRNNTNNRN